MNSVALPASRTSGALGAEADLVRQAARGDEEAFGELFRRHGQSAWRLAQAIALDRSSAVSAVGEGFGRALRTLRRQSRHGSEAFRPLLLAAVYRAAVEEIHRGSLPAQIPLPASAARSRGQRVRELDEALMEAAFRSLPERWRAAVWLGEVEAMEEERIAPVLGVSPAVAAQLLTRGRRGLQSRFAQARRPLPEHLGSALRPISSSVPTSLAEEVSARWKALVSEPGARISPLTGWLSERAVRPLWASVGGLMGLGLIGLGLVGQGAPVNTGPVATGTYPAGASAPGVTPPGLGGGRSGGLSGEVAFGNGLTPFQLSPAGAVADGSGSGVPSGSTRSGNGQSQQPGTAGPLNGSPGNGSGTVKNPGTTPPPGGGGQTPHQSQPSTLLNAGVATVTNSGSTYSVNVLPGSSSASTLTVCSSGVGLTVGTTSYGCPPAGSSSSGTGSGGAGVPSAPTGSSSTPSTPPSSSALPTSSASPSSSSSLTQTIITTVTTPSGL